MSLKCFLSVNMDVRLCTLFYLSLTCFLMNRFLYFQHLLTGNDGVPRKIFNSSKRCHWCWVFHRGSSPPCLCFAGSKTSDHLISGRVTNSAWILELCLDDDFNIVLWIMIIALTVISFYLCILVLIFEQVNIIKWINMRTKKVRFIWMLLWC